MTNLRNFHEGEAQLQAESGVDTAAFDAMADQGFKPESRDSEARFVNDRTFSVAATIDDSGQPWASPLFGTAGDLFEVLDATTVRICAPTVPGDPLFENIRAEAALGVLYFDPSLRRRSKSIGTAEVAGDGSITYRMHRHFGICNKYIFKRTHKPSTEPDTTSVRAEQTVRAKRLSDDDRAQLAQADTVFLASFHTKHGADPTHRGGPAGFISVIDDTTISLPDYTGNGMFQTLGNLVLDDRIGFVSVDFNTGRTIHITGNGAVTASPDSDPFSQRTLTITIDQIRTSWHQPGNWTDIEAFDLRPGLINPATPYL